MYRDEEDISVKMAWFNHDYSPEQWVMSKASMPPFNDGPGFMLSMPPDNDEDFSVYSVGGHAVKHSHFSIPSEYDYHAYHTEAD